MCSSKRLFEKTTTNKGDVPIDVLLFPSTLDSCILTLFFVSNSCILPCWSPCPCSWTVRFVDPDTNLAMIRVPRDFCGKARAALTFMTNLEGTTSAGSTGERVGLSVVASVLSVNGCARTAKLSTIGELRRRHLDGHSSHDNVQTKQPTNKKMLRKLEEKLLQVRRVG